MKKNNILIFIDWFLPGFKAGGPIKSVSNIVSSLHQDFNFYIITSDRDIDDEKPYESEELNKWITKGNYQIAYLSKEKRKDFILETIQKQSFDTYYFNSLYSQSYTLEPLRIIKKIKSNPKIIIAPRGMLGKGALKLKPLKKNLFLIVTKTIGFFKNVIWHATDTQEADDIKLAFGEKSSIYIVPNISLINIQKKKIVKNENELELVFLSRISPKKNLFYALEILKHFINKKVNLTIYGAIEDKLYWEKCNNFIQQNNIKATYKGTLYPTEIQDKLSEYHFLLFPTLHENYGHVIVEALTAGCGLILSNNTPWRDLNQHEVGWDIDLKNKQKFINAIEKCYEMNQENYNSYRKNCYQFITDEINKQNAVELSKQLFLS